MRADCSAASSSEYLFGSIHETGRNTVLHSCSEPNATTYTTAKYTPSSDTKVAEWSVAPHALVRLVALRLGVHRDPR